MNHITSISSEVRCSFKPGRGEPPPPTFFPRDASRLTRSAKCGERNSCEGCCRVILTGQRVYTLRFLSTLCLELLHRDRRTPLAYDMSHIYLRSGVLCFFADNLMINTKYCFSGYGCISCSHSPTNLQPLTSILTCRKKRLGKKVF